MIPVIFNPYPNASTHAEDALDHAERAARNLRHLDKQLAGKQNEPSRLQAQAGEGCDSLRGCVLLREEGSEHGTLSTLLPRLRGQKEQYEAVLWLLAFFSKGRAIAATTLSAHDGTTLEEYDLPVPLLGYAAAQGGIAATVSADTDWHQEFFLLRNPSAMVLNVNSNSRKETLEHWVADWLQNNLDFADYLEARFDAAFYKGALNTLPRKEFHAGLLDAFEKAQARQYVCDGDLLKHVKGATPLLLELRAYGDGARAFFQLRDGRPHIAGFYTKGQAVSQDKAVRQAAQRAQKNTVARD